MTNPEQREKIARIIDPKPWSDVNPYKPEWADHASYERERRRRQDAVLVKADAIIALDPAPESAEGWTQRGERWLADGAPTGAEFLARDRADDTPRPAPDVERRERWKAVEEQAHQLLAARGRFPSGGDVPFDVAVSLLAATLARSSGS